jgi:hypothetical protein
MMDTLISFVTEAGVLGVIIYVLRQIQTERIVMGSRFRDMQQDRDQWRERADGLAERLQQSQSTSPTAPPS